jgi:phosphinothricin acetyltransferase
MNDVPNIVGMSADHALEVLRIFQAGIDTGNATFETTAPTWQAFDADHLAVHRLVALDGGDAVLGWAAAAPVSSRCVYGGVVESSLYVAPRHQGSGVGTRLLTALIDSAEAAGIWTIECGIFPENTASLTLHRRCGFRVVGVREAIGQRDGRWRDVQLLERRSHRVGTSPRVTGL